MAQEKNKSKATEYIDAILVAVAFLIFINLYIVKTFYIPSSSMENTLLIGDHLFVNKFIYGPTKWEWEKKFLPFRDPKRGDVVIFRSKETPMMDLVKRLIGLPGDIITIQAKQLYLNGKNIDESAYAIFRDPFILQGPSAPPRDFFGPFKVRENHFFFLGDNRDFSNDSRFWGDLPRSHIRGRAFLVYWSYGGHTLGANGEPINAITLAIHLIRTTIGFIPKTRWSRTFHVVR